MLTCILSMVEKTKRALTILQQKEEKNNVLVSGNTSKISYENQSKGSDSQTYEADVRQKASELVSNAVKAMDEKVLEVKRKAGKFKLFFFFFYCFTISNSFKSSCLGFFSFSLLLRKVRSKD